MPAFARLEYGRDLLYVLVLKELRVRYKRTVLGYAWSLLQPLAFALVYYIVFKQFIKIETPGVEYTLFLLTAMFSWQWFNNSVTASTMAIVANGPLITKVAFPRIYAVLSGFMNDLVHFLLASPVVFIALWWYDAPFRVSWLWLLPMLIVIQSALVLGLSLLLATLNLFLRDLERLVTIGALMLFNLTPVVYPESLIPERFRWLLYANPMGALTVNWRDAFLHGHVDPTMLLTSIVAAALALVIGWSTFRTLEGRFAELV